MGWFPTSLAGWWLGQLPHLKGVHKSRISSAPDRDDLIDFFQPIWDGLWWYKWKLCENLNSTYLILSHLISSFLFIISYQLIVIDHRLEELFLTVDHCGKHWPKPWPWQCILYHRIQLYKTFIKLQGPWNQVLWTSYNHSLNHRRYEYDSTMMQVYASITQVWKVILIVHVCVYLVASSYFYLL